MQLGRLLVKCGLYEDAVEALAGVGEGSWRQATALHETAVALYRAGKFGAAAEVEAKALAAQTQDLWERELLLRIADQWQLLAAHRAAKKPQVVLKLVPGKPDTDR